MRLVLLRKAPPCPPFLRRSHPGSPSQRLGLHHTQLAHIGTDRCAVDVRRFTAVCLTRILVSVIWLGQHRTRSGDEDQYEQCSFHPGLSLKVAACASAASVEWFASVDVSWASLSRRSAGMRSGHQIPRLRPQYPPPPPNSSNNTTMIRINSMGSLR